MAKPSSRERLRGLSVQSFLMYLNVYPKNVFLSFVDLLPCRSSSLPPPVSYFYIYKSNKFYKNAIKFQCSFIRKEPKQAVPPLEYEGSGRPLTILCTTPTMITPFPPLRILCNKSFQHSLCLKANVFFVSFYTR